jgi:hypothetical protein
MPFKTDLVFNVPRLGVNASAGVAHASVTHASKMPITRRVVVRRLFVPRSIDMVVRHDV